MQTKQINFSKYSSFNIGGTFDVALLKHNFANISNYYLIGSCNNTLVGPNPPSLMMLSKFYDYIKIENNLLKIGGATPSGKIISFCKKNDIKNLEFLAHLPGKLGGLIFMNAGLKEFEIFNYLTSLTTTSGVYQKNEIDYSYRYTNIKEPILEASFEILKGFDTTKVAMFKNMRSNQPSTPSAGSCFKNPIGDYAGRLIEAVGLKGVRVGDISFSKKHANFLVNYDKACFEDAIELIKEAQKKVWLAYHIWLECEIVILEKEYLSKNSPLKNPKNAGLF